jgi:hypothetical protein
MNARSLPNRGRASSWPSSRNWWGKSRHTITMQESRADPQANPSGGKLHPAKLMAHRRAAHVAYDIQAGSGAVLFHRRGDCARVGRHRPADQRQDLPSNPIRSTNSFPCRTRRAGRRSHQAWRRGPKTFIAKFSFSTYLALHKLNIYAGFFHHDVRTTRIIPYTPSTK